MATRSLDPDDMSVFFTSTGGTNTNGLKDAQVDGLFDKQSRTVDAPERKKVVRELEAKLLDLSPIVVVYWTRGNVAHYPELKNYYRGIFFNNNKYEDVWLAK
ncbi:MAG: hypothetical protein HYX92_14200 [Chloroflexi bacterium]|nr:hypothetical protein [Chloroflexota bacterium]